MSKPTTGWCQRNGPAELFGGSNGGRAGGREGGSAAPRRAARATKRVSPRTTKHKQEQRTQEWRRRPERLLYVRTSVCLSASCARQKLSSSFVGEVYIHNEQTTTNQRTNEPTGREGEGRGGEGAVNENDQQQRQTDGRTKETFGDSEGRNERRKAGRKKLLVSVRRDSQRRGTRNANVAQRSVAQCDTETVT